MIKLWTTVAVAVSVALALGAAPTPAADALTLRLGLQATGTVKWEIAAMVARGVDEKHNLELEVRDVADSKAGQIALQAGAVDVILSDFVWVSLQRQGGSPVTMVPHSLTVGGLLVDPAVGIATIADLAGKSIAVSGSPVDKSYVILGAYYNQQTGRVLADDASLRFGAPPLVNELLTGGRADASLNLWNWNARARLDGYTELVSVPAMLASLGIARTPPLLGWTFLEETAAAKREALGAFLDASFETKTLLLNDEAIWDEIRPVMNADDDALFAELRDSYRAGIVTAYDLADQAAAQQLFVAFAEHGGADVVGNATTLAEGTFWTGYGR